MGKLFPAFCGKKREHNLPLLPGCYLQGFVYLDKRKYMKNLFKIITVAIILVFSCKSSGPFTSYEEVINEAKTNHKLILLDFTANWCAGCKSYDKYVFEDSSLIKKLNEKYILYKIKIENNNPESFNLMDKFSIAGLPHIVIIDTSERILGNIVGFDSHYVNDPGLFLSNVEDFVTAQEKK